MIRNAINGSITTEAAELVAEIVSQLPAIGAKVQQYANQRSVTTQVDVMDLKQNLPAYLADDWASVEPIITNFRERKQREAMIEFRRTHGDMV
jgi:hypothetical protein